MTTLAVLTTEAAPEFTHWEIAVLFLVLTAYLAFLMWATKPRGIDRDALIRRSIVTDTDPDDITAALDFPRKQARTSAAIRGEGK